MKTMKNLAAMCLIATGTMTMNAQTPHIKCWAGWRRLSPAFFSLCFLLMAYLCAGQNVGISAVGVPPSGDAGLDVNFTDKGVLIPRVSLSSLTTYNPPITGGGPTTSLLIYNTNTTIGVGYYYWDGGKWVKLLVTGSPSDAWLTLGNAGTTPGTHFLGTTDNVDLVFKTNNTERMRITSGGNVGIGTTTPGVKLHVYGGSVIVENPLATTTNPDAGVIMSLRNPTLPLGSGDIRFLDFGSLDVNTAFIRPVGRNLVITQGNVGIGTASPGAASGGDSGAKLELSGPGGATANNGLRWFSTGNPSGYNGWVAKAYVGNISGSWTTAPLVFSTPNSVGSPLVTLTMINGNVGIGTTSPNVKLEIASGNNTEFLRLNRGGGGPLQIFFGDNLGGVSNPQGVVYFEIGGDETYVMGGHLVPDGHLSRDLGTTGHYWRNAYVNDVYLNSCSTWLSSWVCSDIRYKKEITPLESNAVFKNLLKLQGVYYYWKKEEFPDMHFSDKRQIGLIAQEVEKVFPELVNTNENGYKSIEYAKFAPLFIEAIKELYTKNKELEKKVEMLEKELSNIKSHIGITAEK